MRAPANLKPAVQFSGAITHAMSLEIIAQDATTLKLNPGMIFGSRIQLDGLPIYVLTMPVGGVAEILFDAKRAGCGENADRDSLPLLS